MKQSRREKNRDFSKNGVKGEGVSFKGATDMTVFSE